VAEPYYADDSVTLYAGDCLDVLRELPDASVDAVVTDPPYGLEFMGKDWDAPWKPAGAVIHDPATERGGFQDGNGGNPYSRSRVEYGRGGDASVGFQAWCEQWAAECLRVLRPGGHMLAFGGTRTWHRLACAIEDAGFEVRDSIAWLYGSGFPKSLDVSKAIDRAAGAEREVVGSRTTGAAMSKAASGEALGTGGTAFGSGQNVVSITAPATDDARTWQGWGTALKPAFEPVVVARKPLGGTVAANVLRHGTGALNIDACRIGFASEADERESKDKNRHADFGTESGGNEVYGDFSMVPRTNYDPPGRWPANVVLDESQAAELDLMTDGASRFLYVAKAPTAERPREDGIAHPTVKPLDLMRWLVRLVTPPGGVVLEPFAGSGTTAEACVIEGFRCIAIEREPDYLPLIVQRLTKPIQPTLFGGDVA
jgi:site-specific DNA-methyltransferase (adenine-specific)